MPFKFFFVRPLPLGLYIKKPYLFMVLLVICIIISLLSGLSIAGDKRLPPLHEAVMAGNIEKVTQILEQKNNCADVNQIAARMTIWGQVTQHGARKGKIYKNITALHVAVLEGNIELIKLLLNHGADVNTKEEKGMTPLHFAAMNGNHEAIDILLANKANIDAENNDGRTPFYVAVESRHKEAAKFLLVKGAKEVEVKCFCFKKNNEGQKSHTTTSELICANSVDECIRLTKDAQFCGLFDWQQNCAEDRIWP